MSVLGKLVDDIKQHQSQTYFYFEIWGEDGALDHNGIVSSLFELTFLALGRKVTIRSGASKEEYWSEDNLPTREAF